MNKEAKLPDFLIVGAMKSGTTTLADYLNLHQSIYLPSKELQYFNNDRNLTRGVSWYSRKLMEEFTPSKHGNSVLVGEKTPTYSYQPNCAERIVKIIPNVKLIWIFRDPVKRTFSNYLHARKRGSELLDFRSSIMNEGERIKKDIFKGYVERSKYVLQVDRFLNYFSIDQMHFILFEHLLQSPQVELSKVASFLEIPSFSDDLPQRHSNPTVLPFSPFLLWVAQRTTGYDSIFYKIVSRINYFFPRKKPKVDSELTRYLESCFKPYNQRLADITGLNLDVWSQS